ncbi:hypothetical protein GCM10009646_06620 [Streptomyces aureus]
MPFEEADAHLPFEAADVLAHRRLRAGEVAGDGAEAARRAHGDVDTEIVEGHGANVAMQPIPSQGLVLTK